MGTVQVDTKSRLYAALYELLQTKPYEKIRVSDICEIAGISRQTFYYHFDGKYAIVRWKTENIYANGADEIGRTLTWEEGYLITLRSLERLYGFYSSFPPQEQLGQAVQTHVVRHRCEALRRTISEFKGVKLTKALEVQILALASSEDIIVRSWHRKQIDATADELAVMLMGIVPKELFSLLAEPTNPNGVLSRFIETATR